MYTFTFRISEDKKTFEKVYSEITIQAPDYYDDATITKKDEKFSWLELMSRFWSLPVIPPCGGYRFSFDEPFSPWELFCAKKFSSDCYFELETDYSGDLTKWPSEAKEEEAKIIGVTENGELIRELPHFTDEDFVVY